MLILAKINSLIREFESCVRLHEMMGSDYPETWSETTRQYKASGKALRKAIREVVHENLQLRAYCDKLEKRLAEVRSELDLEIEANNEKNWNRNGDGDGV